MARKLPLGIQDFAKIRENGFLYVDKATRIHEFDREHHNIGAWESRHV